MSYLNIHSQPCHCPFCGAEREAQNQNRKIGVLFDRLDALGDDASSLRVHGIVTKSARLREVRILTQQLRDAIEKVNLGKL